MRRVAHAFVLVAIAAGCGATQAAEKPNATTTSARQLGPRYGISVTLPAGWEGRLRRGALHAASTELSPGISPWTPNAAKELSAGGMLLALFEDEPRRSPPLDVGLYPELDRPVRLGAKDFQPFDGVTEDSRATGHGYARRTFRVSGRFFVLFAESGSRVPSRELLVALNELLGSLQVEAGDFFRGSVEPARFSRRPGWFVGSGGADEARAEGEFTTSWAATIPYADEWNALPPFETLSRLPRDGIVIWLGLSRSNRFPPDDNGVFPARTAPFSLRDFERRPAWEGQVRDLPEYVLWGTVDRQYQIDLRVYFGRRDPSAAMLDEAQAMLEGIGLPDWGPWETR